MSLLLVGDNGRREGRDALALAQLLSPLMGVETLDVRVVPERQRVEPPDGANVGDNEAPDTEIHAGDSAARVLQELAESESAAMLVLGSSHRAGPGRILPGRVAARLLQGSPCPVAVAPRGFADDVPGEPRVIGVAFVDSPEAQKALELAAQLAEGASAALRVISVYRGPPPLQTPGGPPGAYEQAQDALRQAVQPLPGQLRAEPRFRTGDAVTTLVAESELGLDLMVMGSRTYGPLRSVLLGSVSEAVTRGAACPVIVVPRGGQGARGER